MTDGAERKDDRISLAGQDPEDVLRALLKVDPDSEPVEPEQESPESKPEKRHKS